jgi:DNA-binding transcriptional LysR family regulator
MRIEGNIDLKQIVSFMEIVKQGNFTRAARNLKIGQATISHHINNLEEVLRVNLFNRNSRNFEITGEGQIFEAFCLELFEKIENLEIELKHRDTSHFISIGASTIPGTYFLPRVISRIKSEDQQYNYKIEIDDSRTVIDKVRENVLDLGLVGHRYNHPLLEYIPVTSDRIQLIGPPDSPDRLKVEQLNQYPFIARQKGSGTRSSWQEYLFTRGQSAKDLNIVYECSSTESVKQAVIEGIGLAFISHKAIEGETASGSIKQIEVEGMELIRPFYLVYRKNKVFSALEDRVRQYILDAS